MRLILCIENSDRHNWAGCEYGSTGSSTLVSPRLYESLSRGSPESLPRGSMEYLTRLSLPVAIFTAHKDPDEA
jgi:hypothetical protein